MKRTRSIRLLEYVFVRCFELSLLSLPLGASIRLGRMMGWLAYMTDGRHRRIAQQNLRMAFGNDWGEKRIRKTALKAFEHIGMLAAEWVRLPRLIRPYTLAKYVTVRNEEILSSVVKRGLGAIFVSAHIGNWELVGAWLNSRGCRPHTVYRPVENRLIEEHVKQVRERLGFRALPSRGGLVSMFRVVRRRGYLGMLADQHAGAEGIWVDFFGRPASTTALPARLALRTGAPLMLVYARRSAFAFHYELVCDRQINAVPTGDREADVRQITTEVTKRIESYVRQWPEQWLWLHRRWRTPPGEKRASVAEPLPER